MTKEGRQKSTLEQKPKQGTEEQETKKEATEESNYLEYKKIRNNSEEYFEVFKEDFGQSAAKIFTEDGLSKLQNLEKTDQLGVIRAASGDLSLDVKSLEVYLKNNQDVLGILQAGSKSISTSADFCLVSAAADLVVGNDERKKMILNQYIEIQKRRENAPDFLIDKSLKDILEKDEFQNALEDYFVVSDFASQCRFENIGSINTSIMYKQAYENLSEEQKKTFLKSALGSSHNTLLAEEVFNSAFTKEGVENMNSTLKQFKQRYNPAHCMVFKTHQPSASYNENQSLYEYEMNNTLQIGGFQEEYADHKMVLETLKKMKQEEFFKTDEDIDFVIDFWNKNRNPIFANAIVSVLNKNPNRASEKLFEILSDQKVENKNAISAILYRLEFGQIGISEEGVQYLQRIYDLEDLNNPDFFVQRLTSTGDIGIFDDSKYLQGYFNVNTKESENEVVNKNTVKPKIHQFVYETLFNNNYSETEEERQKKEIWLEEFKQNYLSFYSSEFSEKTGVDIARLSFKDQGSLMYSVSEMEEQKKDEVFSFLKEYGESAVRIFNSQNKIGQDVLSQFLEFSKQEKNKKRVQQVVEQYFYFVYSLENFEERIKNQYENINDENLNKILERFTSKANSMLKNIFEGENQKHFDTNGLLKTEIDLFLSITTELKKEGVIKSIEDLDSVDFEVQEGKSILGQKDILQMEEIYKKNYNQRSSEVIQEAIDAFRENLEKENSEIYTLKQDGNIISFVLANKTEETAGKKEVFLSGFNINQDFQEISPGMFVFDKVVNKFLDSKYTIKAHSSLKNSRFYITAKNFVGDEIVDMPGGKGLVISKSKNDKYETQNKKEFTKEYIKNKADENLNFQDQQIAFYVTEDETEFPPEIISRKDFVITQVFQDNQNKRVYFLMEKKKEG